MKNINLKDRDISNKRGQSLSTTVTISAVLLLVAFLIYGVIFGLNIMTKKDVAKVEQEIKNIKKALVGDEYKEVYKFGTRLIDLRGQISSKGFLPLTEDIIKISDKTLSEIRFSGLSAEAENGVVHYKAELIAPDKETLAKQIRVYKQDENFNNVFLTGVTTAESDDLLADLNFDIGKSKPQPTSEGAGVEENF